MRISIVTDAWRPQVNGVVRTLGKTTDRLQQRGHVLQLVTADGRRTFGLPTYPEIRLGIAGAGTIGREIAGFGPDAIHIATEGTLGLAARRFCVRNKLPFTTGYHTRFPEMISMRWPLPGLDTAVHRWFRWFHEPARRVLVPTPSMAAVLKRQGFERMSLPGPAASIAISSAPRPRMRCRISRVPSRSMPVASRSRRDCPTFSIWISKAQK